MLASPLKHLRVKRLSHSVATLLALSSPWAAALPTTWTVNSCSDAVIRSSTTSFLPAYPYPRGSGPAAGIGAYEVLQKDIFFNTGFDGCP